MSQSEFEKRPAKSAGKCARACRDWFLFLFSLVEKEARVLMANHRPKQSKEDERE